MTYLVAVQANHIDTLRFETDSSLLIAHTAQKRGHRLFFYTPENLSLVNGRPVAYGHLIHFTGPVNEKRFTKGRLERLELSDAHIILLRQNPPFDLAYITSTHILEHLSNKSLVVNNPIEVRNCPEKLFITHFPNLLPPTLISRDLSEIRDFMNHHDRVIVKPLYQFGGKGVFLTQENDPNFNSLLETLFDHEKSPFVFQKFISEVAQGDKRILLLDGELLGYFARIPQENQVRANTVAGGDYEKTLLTPRDEEIVETLKPHLKSKGLLFVGLDVIGGYLTEVNVTSPTGLALYNKLYNTSLEETVWDKIEEIYNEKYA